MPLGPEDEFGKWISHYYNSDHPMFNGVSKAGRLKMAAAAYHKAKKDHAKRHEHETKTLRKTFKAGAGPRKVTGGKLRKDKREDTRGFSYKSLKEMIVHFGVDDKRKEKHRSKTADIIKRSYQSLGGYGGEGSGSDKEDDLIHDDYNNTKQKMDITTARLRKKSNGKYDKVPSKLNAVAFYKNKNGQKAIGVGHDGSRDGKAGARKLLKLVKNPKHQIWGEFSGPLKYVADKMGLPKVPNKHAQKLVGKEIKPIDDHQYDRNIRGRIHTKAIYGHPKIEKDD